MNNSIYFYVKKSFIARFFFYLCAENCRGLGFSSKYGYI